jgi:hypothetical protein
MKQIVMINGQMYMANKIKSNESLCVKNSSILFDFKRIKEYVQKRLENCQSKLEEAMSKNLIKVVSEYEIIYPNGHYSIPAERAMLKVLDLDIKSVYANELSELEPLMINQIIKAYSEYSEDKETINHLIDCYTMSLEKQFSKRY